MLSLSNNNGKYYIYRHIRLDTGRPFYIGIGTKGNSKIFRKYETEYARALDRKKRSNRWKNTVKNNKYSVEILMESNDYKFIENKEIEFIKLYGRIDQGTGILVNMTDGGNTTIKIKNENANGIPQIVYIYCALTGKYITKCKSQEEAAKFCKCSTTTISGCILNKLARVKTYIVYNKYKGITVKPRAIYNKNHKVETIGKAKRKPEPIEVIKVDYEGNIVEEFKSIESISEKYKYQKGLIWRRIYKNSPYDGSFWMYKNKPFDINTYKFIYQYNFKGDFIGKYSTSTEASKKSGISRSIIIRNVNNMCQSGGGFIWSYKPFEKETIPYSGKIKMMTKKHITNLKWD